MGESGHAERAPAPVQPAQWIAQATRGHAVQFYDDTEFLVDGLSGFVGAALSAGDAAVVLATPVHRTGLAAALAARGLDLDLAVRQGRYVALDAAEVLAGCLADGMPDAARFEEQMGALIGCATAAARGAHPRVAVFGEMVALLVQEGQVEAALRLERLWNDLAARHAFTLLCAYPIHSFDHTDDGEVIEQICSAHAHVIPAESYTALDGEQARLRAITLWQQKAEALEREIVERRRVEQTLRERNHELDEAVKARDEFLSVAAHELKTPLTSLRAFAQVLLRDGRGEREISRERLAAALNAIELQTGKLSRLVGRLLTTGQIEASRLRVEPVSTDLAALVRSALPAQPEATGHTVVVDGPERLEALVDPVRFEQVIANLLDNAVKFSPGGGEVTVRLGRAPDGGAWLSVADQGVGVPPDQREQIFERFQQAANGPHLSGMGLGLFITREIVHQHGGTVHLDADAPSGGARFIVTLPPATHASPPVA